MPQDAITLLDADHERVELLFRDYQSAGADSARKTDLAQIICLELAVHASLEEELFYPAFARATGEEELVREAEREHQEARELINRIQSEADPDALVLELQRSVEHHVDEERREIFPRARAAGGLDLAALANELESRRSELVAQLQQA